MRRKEQREREKEKTKRKRKGRVTSSNRKQAGETGLNTKLGIDSNGNKSGRSSRLFSNQLPSTVKMHLSNCRCNFGTTQKNEPKIENECSEGLQATTGSNLCLTNWLLPDRDASLQYSLFCKLRIGKECAPIIKTRLFIARKMYS